MYRTGKGVEKNMAESVRWLRSAAESGQPSSQFMLGLAYAMGEGVPKSTTEAVQWVRLAAEQGSTEGQNSLGYAYATGTGVTQDLAEAYKWYRLAVAEGNMHAELNLKELAPRLTEEQILTGKARAALFSPQLPRPTLSPAEFE
jgi:hypothetical protein